MTTKRLTLGRKVPGTSIEIASPPPAAAEAAPSQTVEIPAVEFLHVTKRYRRRDESTLKEFLPAVILRRAPASAFNAVDDVSFTVNRGETVGIIGRNGSGKSTVLKLTAGVTAPTSGEIITNGRIAPLIELGAGFHVELTGQENVYLNGTVLGMNNRRIAEVYDSIVEFAELQDFMDTAVKHYSSGMFIRLAFAVAVHCEPDIMVLDEGLGVGDLGYQEKCLDKIREFQRSGVTVLLVSHGITLVESFCQRVIFLESGRKVMDGDPHEVVEAYRASMEGHTAVHAGA